MVQMVARNLQIILLVGAIILTSARAEDGIVVHIQCNNPQSVGSGVIVSNEGHVLTAKHVAGQNSSCDASIGSTEGKRFDLEFSLLSDEYDAALFKIQSDLVFTKYATICPLQKQREVRTAGFHPFVNGPPARKDGIVSTVNLKDGSVEISAPVIPAESGGPVFLRDTSSIVGIIKGADFDAIGQPIRRMVPAIVLTSFELKIANDCSPKEQIVTAELKQLIDELRRDLSDRASAAGVTEKAIIFLAQRISNDTSTVEQALTELENAVEIAIRLQERTVNPEKNGEFVDLVLAEISTFASEGQHDLASIKIDEAISKLNDVEAGIKEAKIELLSTGIEADLLRRDVDAAAARIVKKLSLEHEDLFDELDKEQTSWYTNGVSNGVILDLQVAVSLSKYMVKYASNSLEEVLAKNSLGLALTKFGEKTGNKISLNEAIKSYKVALSILGNSSRSLNWFIIQNNLGTALVSLGQMISGNKQLEQAVEILDSVLEVISYQKAPDLWAKVQNNLGNALLRLGEQDTNSQRLERALNAYENASEIWNRNNAPLNWAATQNNIGVVLKLLGDRGNEVETLKKSGEAFKSAVLEWEQSKFPSLWANARSNLGTVYVSIGEKESSSKLLVEAISLFKETLVVRTKDRSPVDWASTHNNIGVALTLLGERTGEAQLLKQAIYSFRKALEERAAERNFADWAESQSNLAAVLIILGRHENVTSRLEEAVNLLNMLLEKQNEIDNTIDKAATQNNLGAALIILGERKADMKLLETAVDFLEKSLEIRIKSEFPQDWATSQNNLGNALARLGKLKGDVAILNSSVSAYKNSLLVRTRDQAPLDWATSQFNLGRVLISIGTETNDADVVNEAIDFIQLSLAERPREQFPFHWARSKEQLALANMSLFQETKNEIYVKKAIDQLNQAHEAYFELTSLFHVNRVERAFKKLKRQ